jgi:spermidine/putrescine transport system permease protein
VILVVQARLVGIRRDVEEAALSLGASPVQTFFSVTLPLSAAGGRRRGALRLHHFVRQHHRHIVLEARRDETVPTQIFAMLRHSISPEINALGTVMIVMTVGLPLLGAALARKLAMKRGG